MNIGRQAFAAASLWLLVFGTAACGSNVTSGTSGGDAGTDSLTAPDGSETDATEPDATDAETAAPDGGEQDATEPEGCADDECEIDGVCYANETPNPDNPCEICLVPQGREEWTWDDAGTCDDGDACTADDFCLDGECMGWGTDCDDENACTTDRCDAETGACSHADRTGACDDGNACTLNDSCVGGSCVGGAAAPDCDDGDPCTDDSCDATLGCVHAPGTGAACDDTNPCTEGDACAEGVCVGGAPTSCDDGSVCTIDKCDPAEGCKHESIAEICADTNPCTDELCDPEQGCIYPFNTNDCDDGSECTENDICTEGACIGSPIDPDDGEVCTDDYCDPDTGPYHENNDVQCDDANLCTLGDRCDAGSCVPGPNPLDCDDGNPCTDDSCDPELGCVHTDNVDACDDGDACTDNDICDQGACGGSPIVCDDGNDCTTNSCNSDAADPSVACEYDLIVSNACRPNIVVTYPERAATLVGDCADGIVTVTGNVFSGAGPITSFTINGVPVGIDGGTGAFSYDMTASVGNNVLVFEAQDSFGTAKKRVQSFMWSTYYYKADVSVPGSGMVDPGMGIWLGQTTLDDGDHSLPANDLATIFEVVLANMGIENLIPNPAAQNLDLGGAPYNVYINNLAYGAPKVSLTATDTGLRMNATMSNIYADIQLSKQSCSCSFPYLTTCCLAPGTINGNMTASAIVIDADIALNVKADHTLDVALAYSDVQIVGLDINISLGSVLDFLLGWLVDWLVDLFTDGFVGDIEAQFNAAIQDQIAPILEDALTALAFNMDFDLPSLDGSGATIPLSLESDFSFTEFHAGVGGALGLRARAFSPNKATPYDNLGVPARTGCCGGPQYLIIPGHAPMEVVFADDTLNEILYAAWSGGMLEFPVGPDLLGGMDLSEYGIDSMTMNISGMLAPLASDCGAGNELEMHIGDLKVTANMSLFGQTLDMVAYVSMKAGITLEAIGGEIAITVSTIDPDAVHMEIDILQENMVDSEAAIEALIADNLIPAIEGMLGGGEPLASFPLPEIDISEQVGLPAGQVVIAIETLSDPSWPPRIDGNTIVYGKLK